MMDEEFLLTSELRFCTIIPPGLNSNSATFELTLLPPLLSLFLFLENMFLIVDFFVTIDWCMTSFCFGEVKGYLKKWLPLKGGKLMKKKEQS
jgi:hypothetical protein